MITRSIVSFATCDRCGSQLHSKQELSWAQPVRSWHPAGWVVVEATGAAYCSLACVLGAAEDGKLPPDAPVKIW